MPFKARFALLFLYVLLSSCTHVSDVATRCPADAFRCDSAFESQRLDFALGEEQVEGRNIQFGAEVEYVKKESAELLSIYVPDPKITKIQPDVWVTLPLTKKLEVLEQYQKRIFSYRAEAKIYLYTKDPRLLDFLPPTLVYDVSNFEIVMKPVDSFSKVLSDLTYLLKVTGEGSLQLTLSTPKKQLRTEADRDRFYNEQLGHLNFVNELDVMEKLDNGLQKYKSNPQSWAVASFNHPHLGPMTKNRQGRLKKLIRQLADGEILTESQIKALTSGIISSKFIGGVSFRPDVAQKQDRLASEIRHCHKSLACLEQIALREIKYLKNGYSYFTKFVDLEPFDVIYSFNQLSAPMKDFLKELFPRTRDHRVPEVELYRNFSYPLRDWGSFIALNKKIKHTVPQAQNSYVDKISKIQQRYVQKKVSREDSIAEVMGALAAFPRESGLLETMQKYATDYGSTSP